MSDEHVPPSDRKPVHREFADLLSAADASGAQATASAEPDAQPRPSGPVEEAGKADDPGAQGAAGGHQGSDTGQRPAQPAKPQLPYPKLNPVELLSSYVSLQARWLTLSTEMMSGWFELFGRFAQGVGPVSGVSPLVRRAANAASTASSDVEPPVHPAPRPSGAAPPPPEPPAPSKVSIAYQVSSSRPAYVYAEFLPGRERIFVTSRGIRHTEKEDAPPVYVGCEARPDESRVVVKVHVPEDQPSGLYSGALLDSGDGSHVGNLSLQLS